MAGDSRLKLLDVSRSDAESVLATEGLWQASSRLRAAALLGRGRLFVGLDFLGLHRPADILRDLRWPYPASGLCSLPLGCRQSAAYFDAERDLLM